MLAVLTLAALMLVGCRTSERASNEPLEAAASASMPSTGSPSAASPTETAPPSDVTGTTLEARSRRPLTVLLGGDVDFSRVRGERLVREPDRDDFAPLASLFERADVRFANLESTVSDRFEEDRRAPRPLVFTAPPIAARAVARGRLDVVSLANNHAWDFGEAALVETLDALSRVGVATVGAGRTRAEAHAPQLVRTSEGVIAFVAVTSAWNQRFDPHPGKERIADDDLEALATSIAEARRQGAEQVIVSHHGGEEYGAEPSARQRDLARFAIDAGADVVVGHHAHVVQRAARIDGKPVLYGLGNLLMRMVTAHPETEFGALARVTFGQGGTRIELCPVRAHGLDVVLAAEAGPPPHDATRFRASFERLQRIAVRAHGETALELGAFETDGCAPLLDR
jgi:poly-gamma-glutamate capsule biosynthesis protein CapA/YwtB (metallophosphatase superfamily)